jgi:hypothetical protein
MKGALTRVFVGVESGSDSQLRRYGKGQTTTDIVAALRAGSLLGLPLEFGFITFDPLLAQEELGEILAFLGRTDIVLPAGSADSAQEVYAMAISDDIPLLGAPVFTRVAYMATELELFINSPFLRLLQKTAPELIGEFDPGFARYTYSYRDPDVGHVANLCRVWTEGAFEVIYRMRLAARSARVSDNPFGSLIDRYRIASYGLLLSLTCGTCSRVRPGLLPLWETYCKHLPLRNDSTVGVKDMQALWNWVVTSGDLSLEIEPVVFRPEHLERRRDT